MKNTVDMEKADRKSVVALRIAEKARPLFAGHPPDIQGAAICDLIAIYLAGHIVPKNPEQTAKAREVVLQTMVRTVRELIPYMEQVYIKPKLEGWNEQRGDGW